MYIVMWKRRTEDYINKEYCRSYEEALRWVESHKFYDCVFCHIEKGD